jgi:hypothetical protein
VVRRHVTHDRQPETGAAGVPAAGLVDAVEALEDPIVVAGGDPDPVVGDHQLGHGALHPHADLHRRARLAVLHRVLDQVAERRHELAPVARHAHPDRHVERGDVDAADVGERTDPLDRLPDHVLDVDQVADRFLTQLDPGELHEVVDRVGHSMRLLHHPPGDAADDVGIHVLVGGVGKRLGEHGEGAHRRLQLVADVGDEVGPHGVDPAPLADILDRDHRPAAGQRGRPNDDGDARRAVEVDGLSLLAALERTGEQALDGVIDEEAGVAPVEHTRGRVAVVDAPTGTGDHDAEGEPIGDIGPSGRCRLRLVGAGARGSSDRGDLGQAAPVHQDQPGERQDHRTGGRDHGDQHGWPIRFSPGRSPPPG